MKKYPKPDELFKFDLDNMKLEDENFRVLIKRECQNKNMVNFENKCFCGIGETLDSTYTTAFFIDYCQLFDKNPNRITCDYKILGYSKRGRRVYEALVEHSIVDGKDKMKIDRNAVYDDGNENHGIGSAGLQVIIDLARRLGCTEVYGMSRPYTEMINSENYDLAKKRLRHFYEKNGFIFGDDGETFHLNL